MRYDEAPPSIRVLVIDSTRVHTELLADALKRDECLQVTTLSPDPDRLTTHFDAATCDVLLISSTLGEQPGRGFETLRGLRALDANLKAVVLLEGSRGEAIAEAFRSGARGVFSKNESVDRLGKCIRRVYEGQIWADSGQVATLIQALSSSHNIRAVDAHGLSLLSKREMEVVRCVALGLSNREIAERLQLSQHTIKNCLFRIFDKLGVSSRVELLFMTLSEEKNAQTVLQHLLSDRGCETLGDEATLGACQNAAHRGVLMAQIALAQHYGHGLASQESRVKAYAWYSVAAQQISRSCQDLARSLNIEQLLEAEEMASQVLSEAKESCMPRNGKDRKLRRNLRSDASRKALSAEAS